MTLRNPSPEGIGKAVADRLYLHVDSLSDHADTPEAATLLARLAQAEALAKVRRGEQFNLVRVDSSGSTLGLLHYPGFSDDAFPSLAPSWRVDLDTGSVGYRTYADSLNPPILHRKELLLPEDDPRRELYAALTAACESIGLFDDPKRDQHAAHELNRRSQPICHRLGAAVDFIVEDESMLEVAQWVVANTPFDRLYFYGDDKPIHVSFGPNHDRQIVRMVENSSGTLLPRVVARDLFLAKT